MPTRHTTILLASFLFWCPPTLILASPDRIAFVGATLLDGNVMPYVLQMREAINAGEIAGPRIKSVGSLVDGADPIWLRIERSNSRR